MHISDFEAPLLSFHHLPNGDSRFSEPLLADGLEGCGLTLGGAVQGTFALWQGFASGPLTLGYLCITAVGDRTVEGLKTRGWNSPNKRISMVWHDRVLRFPIEVKKT